MIFDKKLTSVYKKVTLTNMCTAEPIHCLIEIVSVLKLRYLVPRKFVFVFINDN